MRSGRVPKRSSSIAHARGTTEWSWHLDDPGSKRPHRLVCRYADRCEQDAAAGGRGRQQDVRGLQCPQGRRHIGAKRRHPLGRAVAVDAARYIDRENAPVRKMPENARKIVGDGPRKADAEQRIDN